MKLLADENCPRALVIRLRERGHDVVWIREVSPGAPDDAARAIADALDAHPGWEGAFSVVEDSRVRRRQLD